MDTYLNLGIGWLGARQHCTLSSGVSYVTRTIYVLIGRKKKITHKTENLKLSLSGAFLM